MYKKTGKILLNYCLLIPFIIAISCNDNSKIEKHDVNFISFEGYDKNFDNIKLSDLAQSIQYLPLETNAECLLGNNLKIIVQDKLIYINDVKNNSIYIFNLSNGKFITKVGESGHGPGEYIKINSFAINPANGFIYLLDNNDIKIYNKKGSFVRKITINNYPSSIGFLSGQQIILQSSKLLSLIFKDLNLDLFTVIDTLGIEKFSIPNKVKYENIKPAKIGGLIQHYSLSHYKNTPLLYEPLFDTVYIINKSLKKEVFCILDFGKNKIPPEIYFSDAQTIREKGAKYINFPNLLDSKNIIFVLFKHHNTIYRAIYDKTSSDLKVIPINSSNNGGIFNDLDYGLDFWPMYISNENVGVSYIHAYKIKELINKNTYNEKDSDFAKLVQKISANDNPVLQLVQFK